MDYLIADRQGFALITQRATGKTVIAVPLRGVPSIFAFVQLFTFDTEQQAQDVIAALIASGARPEDYSTGEADGQGHTDLQPDGR